MSGPSGVPRHRTFDPTFNPTATVPRERVRTAPRPAPRHRALGLALGTLAAPALVVLALTAFGAMRDEPEAGLGSLPAAEGLQGSAKGAPQPGGEKVATGGRDEEERDDTELADAEPGRDGAGARKVPVPADCPGPRARSSKRRAAVSDRSARAAGCAEAEPPRQVDGDLRPQPGASTNPPVADEPSQGTATEGDFDESGGSDDPGRSGEHSP